MTSPHTPCLPARAVVLVCAIAAALPGCSLIGRKVRECEGFDVPLSVYVGPSRKELRSRVLASGVDETFPFVAEANAESMVIVGFTPLGTKSFTLTRKGDEVDVDNVLGAGLKVSPRNVMADVLAMSLPSSCATAPDGDVASNFDSWKVVDTCSDNRPLKRTIARATAGPGGTPAVEIEYRPEAIVVRQKQCRYTAAYVLQVSAPIPGVDVRKSDADAEAAEAAAPATTAPVVAPPAPPAATPDAPAPVSAPPTPPATPDAAAPASAPPAAPAATPEGPAAAPPTAATQPPASAEPAAPPAATKPSGMLVPSPAGSPVLVPAN